ncbi:metallopeptidase TldD-related protein [Streptomyces violaceoruber]|uniref:Metalloprotease TldD/E C-terminal domain-containing protein n=2 Tax=Streptomyces TaxID=1883 RepID=Q9RJ51_STRCO|nr:MULTISPECIES: metallopeptidase TldD-related protein [Streptomyces]MDX2926584.1 metallopeptidase TldD-related protein [Streptomyces sp. NRRL_B-16638]MDX3368122.1 metallopeptidase TldD-related protein [Streptomyces sp. ME02-6987-2C]MDX3409390.1 metallopeptidase TldD-related protein [Streptomyces sp. ME02-6977A]MDX3424521.1 metallopeptidase TldD-related protein [Streptomyces sp. ME02-6985-2c]MYU41341.1 TldD/PmbA family protein [Streptomyces sp. SID7813]
MSVRSSKPHEVVERALELSRADGCVVIADEESTANLRWAGNTLTTNGVTRGRTLTVVATVDGREGTASGVVSRSAVTLDELEPLVRAAEAAARNAGPAEDAQPLVTGGAAAPDFTDAPAETSSAVFADFAPALGEAFARARAGDRELYGFANHEMTSTYVGTSTGLRLRHDQPNGTLELNAKSPDRTRSAWAGRATRDFKDVDPAALDAELAVRLGWAERRVELPAGRYETLLPPTAVADLLIYQYWSASGRDAVEGRTVFSKPGGTRVGERLGTLPLTLRSDPHEPGLESAPFVVAHSSGGDQSVFDNGLPVAATDWIRDGELHRLTTTRHSAGLTGLPVAPAIGNLVLDGGDPDRSLDEMVAGTERGLLLTCLWYIREVDPATLLLTGLTRDGVYLVEHGEVVGEVNNFRFNESPVGLLGRASEAGRTEKTLPREWGDWFTRTAMPALRVPDFNMSSVSQGV